jgi:hypothetical protein
LTVFIQKYCFKPVSTKRVNGGTVFSSDTNSTVEKFTKRLHTHALRAVRGFFFIVVETNNSEKKRRGKEEKRERKRRREGKRGGKDYREKEAISINSSS